MERVKLVGEYYYRVPMPCHFEDIPIFLKMADLGKNNSADSVVMVCKLSSGKNASSLRKIVVPEKKEIVRWKIVKDKWDNLFLAYRTLNRSHEWHCYYAVCKGPYGKINLCKCKDN